MNLDGLLARLEGVRMLGPSHGIAKCPAHEDRSPSLSVRELSDGRILIHDFGGCETCDVLGALGLNMSDLFEQPLGQNLQPSRSRIPAGDVLAAIDHEAQVIAVIATDLLEHRDVDEATWTRLATAVVKIGEARAAAAPAKLPK